MKILITGATGFVGQRLVPTLADQNHQLVLLVRDPDRHQQLFQDLAHKTTIEWVQYGPKESGDWQNAVSGCDAVIHLAGEPLAAGRWTSERKAEILASRSIGTEKLVEAIAQANPRPQVLISTSAIGYYGTSETETFQEESGPGQDFLGKVCQAWEGAAQPVTDLGVRLVILRFGIVLGLGGAIGQMLPAFKLYAGGPIGSGRQWFSWIHQDDLVALICYALEHPDFIGVYNATAPNPVSMGTFCQTLAEVLDRPSWLPVPDFILTLLLGEAAQVVLQGQRVLPQRTLASGFEFQYPTVKTALEDIL
ncbi:TIGR01777 family oxidoreductase [Candidatus Synechococcus calcipolaris G9]|uniref:TIGR01777 family oxidoreductase n=1 Tax=Candidatus Synechococcus calcipolaris G9 TaxID=1497997 RepID=A0ABT6F2Q4_9SYNE|nr:TIGR01777 family oxidoreductase [Candidatus Synechococcus calcipolaris]MDG2992119.1 TIGR01777 family oxidoreductase [Candidatus Synechococcus calcipolaris G9]